MSRIYRHPASQSEPEKPQSLKNTFPEIGPQFVLAPVLMFICVYFLYVYFLYVIVR